MAACFYQRIEARREVGYHCIGLIEGLWLKVHVHLGGKLRAFISGGAALSPEAWAVLRRRDGLSVGRATAVWRLTLTALLSQGFASATE